ncbi:MAG: class I SAM-dependent methyltransferase, partial [Methylobacterium sp.]|nr:class I SAM-dependent methyltransferase [Methylobacterium sp.]
MVLATLRRWLGGPGRPHAAQAEPRPADCPVCGGALHLLDRLDLNRACEDTKRKVFPVCGIPIAYYLCEDCGHCHAPEMASWQKQRFAEAIYNQDYARVDPDYLEVRPQANAALIAALLTSAGKPLSHLDYGGGSGLLSGRLRELGWDSATVDPYLDDDSGLPADARFDLITAFEVFEHVPDAAALVADLARYAKPGAAVLFRTLLNDGQIVPGHSR